MSLYTSIGGIALMGLVMVAPLLWRLQVPLPSPQCAEAFIVLLESVAFGCGIAAKRTATGKAGLVISAGVGVFFVVGLCYAVIRFFTQPLH